MKALDKFLDNFKKENSVEAFAKRNAKLKTSELQKLIKDFEEIELGAVPEDEQDNYKEFLRACRSIGLNACIVFYNNQFYLFDNDLEKIVLGPYPSWTEAINQGGKYYAIEC